MLISISEILFWLGCALLLYTYFGYLFLLLVLSKISFFKKASRISTNNYCRSVTLLIAAYNEENVIRAKLENSLHLDYPNKLFNIIVASDGSTDRTNEIVEQYSAKYNQIKLLEFARLGKSRVLNEAVNYIEDDIIVFSDANTEYSPDAVKKIIKYFDDPEVGCVSGRLVYRNPGEVISGRGESFYWRYETILKKLESKIGYVAGANGAIYAIRRKLFTPLLPKTINDDFTTSMKIVKNGYKSIYEEGAIAYEDVAPTVKSEFDRHVRDGAGHYIAVMHLLGLLNPFLGLRFFIYLSHRIFRWLAPFVLIILFILNIGLLSNLFYISTFIFQITFYVVALIGSLLINRRRFPFFIYVPYYFCNLNFALLLGFIKAITGKQKMTWERTERSAY